jgi:hypothetical protein
VIREVEEAALLVDQDVVPQARQVVATSVEAHRDLRG